MNKYLLLTLIIFNFSLNSYAEMFPTKTSKACVNYAKKILKGNLTPKQLKQLKSACRFNDDSFCVYELTKGISYLKYNEFDEVINLVRMCQFVRPQCVGVVKKYLTPSEYQSNESIAQITRICVDTSYKCLDFECANAKDQCGELSHIKLIAPSCLR